MGLFFVNARNCLIQGVQIGPTAAFSAIQQACVNMTWRDIHLAQNDCHTNQDGIDVGPGCRNIVIDGITGHTGDDLCSVYAQNTSPPIHAYARRCRTLPTATSSGSTSPTST
ncbi:glycosyl hydrolase family 28 protein [Nocardioides flavescens]|uniref:Uncharacterized protein n=1 Tax=Nocardioides flavescens TaxID=2691959 RepID=A0A6L7EVY7_9ACTN|nr:glycosyl hydrolase family 28 protein [Nocardioides flavescens]MXG89906.1 hypothetical protein [Nocardioides flavescens]